MRTFRFLIVDDEKTVRKALATLLAAHEDWPICGEAQNGLDAIEKARTLQPDVVLMDVSMPQMNGLDAARILRRDYPEIAVVIVSQNDPTIVRLQALQVDAAGYVGKTNLSRDLIPTLERMLQKREAGGSGEASGDQSSGNSGPSSPVGHDPSQTALGDGTRHGPLNWLASSEMTRLIRAKNWSETPIGPEEHWSPALRMMVSFLLANRFPLLLWWGPQYVSIYNDAYRPILGTKHPTALGLPVSECWSEIWNILQPLIDTPFKGGPPTWMDDIELEIRRSGFTEETHFTVAYSPVPDETAPGGIGGVLATVHEITEKIISERRVAILADLGSRAMEARTAEGACKAAAEVLSVHSKDVPFALIYLVDQREKKARLSGAAGISPGEVVAPLDIDFSETPGGGLGPRLFECVRDDQTTIVEGISDYLYRVPHGPWGESPHTAVLVPVRSNKEHDLAGVLVVGVSSRLALDSLYRSFFELVAAQIATAIGKASAYEDERRRAEALAEIDRAKTVFFSNVSHEFRTPLTLMLGPLEEVLAREQNSATQETRSQLEVVHRNSLRLLKLVNTLLDFSRIEAGRTQARYSETNLGTITGELASVFVSAMKKASLNYIIDCPPLPEPVFVDRDMWEKIVFNLISNAFKFTPTGEVRVQVRAQNGHAVLSVIDSGIGIPRWELPNVFKRFHRIENPRARTQEGTGIGLALAQELVKLHCGSMTVESKPGFGTTFEVHIPFGKEHLPEEQVGPLRPYASTAMRAESFVDEAVTWLPEEVRETSEKRASVEANPSSTNVQPQRILLAEDNADMRDYVRRLLSSAYTVQAVSTGSAALEAARRNPPDLILSDIMMPELNGLELVRHLRADARFSLIPIILLSARAGEEARIEGVTHGADDYLTKPFSTRELLGRVAAHLNLARTRRQAEENIRQRTAQFETLINEAPLGVYLIDADFCIRQVNPTARPMFGEIPDLIGRDFGEVVHTLWPRAYADELVAQFRHTLETGEPYLVPEQKEDRRDQNSSGYSEWQVNRIPLPSGGHGVVCYFRDISTQKETEEALRNNQERYRMLSENLEAQVQLRTAEIAQRNAEVLEQAEQLRELSQRLMQTQDEERRHVAQELHDTAGQFLTVLGTTLGRVVEQVGKNTPHLTDDAENCQKLVQQLSQEIRTTSYLLHPPLLDEAGLPQALHWYIQGLQERSRLRIDLNISEDFGRLSLDLELVLFRLVQECLTNVHRHSGGTHAVIDLRRTAGHVLLEVQDAGTGIPAKRLAEIQTQGSGVGIRGMRERARQFKGEMQIESTAAGTKISFRFPLRKSAKLQREASHNQLAASS